MTASRAVLVTGCSTGIGRATALRLHRAGLPVYATARHAKALADLGAQGISTLPLDVTDEESAVSAVNRVVSDHGAVGVLVNNAGSGAYGTVEDMPLERSRAAFETNVFGMVRLIQLVLPGMRAQRSGRIVNVSSVLGRVSPPGASAYQATKHAVEAYSDALRLEVTSFGVRVCVIEPAVVRTAFFDTALGQFTRPAGGPYAGLYTDMAEWARDVARGRRMPGRFAVPADKVAAVIERAVVASRPRARYAVGPMAAGLLLMRRLLPDALFDAFVRWQFPAP
jgi:NAD(P)-dependent dehydrogenase (short-subunit alcohol dehydrogenase family)